MGKKGEGMLFSVDLIDKMNDEITATFFNEGVNKFYEHIVQNNVYTFEAGRIDNNR